MNDKETFPNSIWEFLLDNSFKDDNWDLLIPTHIVKQAIEHYYESKERSDAECTLS